jgi:NAD(P)-dependent dehydrogenase (short-subunit alcohol dehydrogenase family)
LTRLAGQLAVITGAAGGIGRATSAAFLREGAVVIAVDRDGAALRQAAADLSKSTPDVHTVECDVSDETSVERMFAAAERIGTVTTLVNNAGVVDGRDAVATSVSEWDRTIGVNLKGVWLCSKALTRRALDERRAAVIVNTSSTNAFYAEPGQAAYTASKGGVSALTRSMALDYARFGIRVNCVCPGIVESTGMTEPYLRTRPNPDATRRHWASLHPLGRLATPDDVAQAIVFLASPEASFITGSELVVDGGFSIGTALEPPESES